MNCPSCLTPNSDLSRFCSACGAAMRNPSSASVPSLEDEATGVRQTDSAKHELVKPSSDPLLGSTIAGKYRIEAKLGAGGMGAVYRATRLIIGDEVAVKILHSEQSDPRSGERFRREAQAAARLKHSNAVAIYDFGITEDGLQYLVMDLVEGESLRQIIKYQGPITPSASVEIISQVCAALGEAHRLNVIHRDIKPDNVIVNSTPNGLRVKVLDFGIAKLRDDVVHTLTQTGGIIGTPHYMSPEQCLGEELDGRSDIYSLGIVLYEMLTGRVPFNSPISTAVVIQHVNQPPPPFARNHVGITAAMEQVVLRALAKRREDRPQVASELARSFSMAVNEVGPVSLDAAADSGSRAAFPLDSIPATTLLNDPFGGGTRTSDSPTRRRLRPWMVAVGFSVMAVMLVVAWKVTSLRAFKKDGTAVVLENSYSVQNPASPNFSKNFAGLVGGRFRINMKLRREGSDLSGTYFYRPTNDFEVHGNQSGKPDQWADKDISAARMDVSIRGSVDEQRNFQLEEFNAKGAKVGMFKGRFISDTEIDGTWTKINGKQPTSFSLKEDGSQANGRDYTIIAKQILRRKAKWKVDISYPQLEGLADDNVQRNFNERIRAFVSKDLGGFSDGEGTQSIGFTIDYRSGELLSVIFGAFYDWTGAAHPQHNSFSYNYDLKRDREIKLADLFIPGANHLSVISKICARDIAKEKRKNGFTDIYEDGEAAAYEVLKEDPTFYLTETALVFIFDPYQVGSYAEGYYVVSIPYSQLTNKINGQGPLAPFLS